MKKSKLIPALFAALLVVSALSGCGKKNDDQANLGYGVGIYPGYTGGGVVAQSFAVGGQLQISGATGWAYGMLQAGGGGAIGGQQYVRTNQSGDQVVLTVAGTGTVAAYATVFLSQSSVSFIQYYCGGSTPSGIEFSGTPLTAGSPGSIASSVTLYVSGRPCVNL